MHPRRGADDPDIQAWPALLGRFFGVPHVNLARDGCSNRRIVRSTVSRIDEVRRQSDLLPEDVLVMIAWTQSSRHEYYSLRDRPEVRTSPPTANHPDDRHWQGIGPWRQDTGHRPSRAYYDQLWSDEGQLANKFLDWVMLDRLLPGPGGHPLTEGHDWFATSLAEWLTS